MNVIEGPWERFADELADTLEAERALRPAPRACAYCGAPCYGAACHAHGYLTTIERRLRGDAA